MTQDRREILRVPDAAVAGDAVYGRRGHVVRVRWASPFRAQVRLTRRAPRCARRVRQRRRKAAGCIAKL